MVHQYSDTVIIAHASNTFWYRNPFVESKTTLAHAQHVIVAFPEAQPHAIMLNLIDSMRECRIIVHCQTAGKW